MINHPLAAVLERIRLTRRFSISSKVLYELIGRPITIIESPSFFLWSVRLPPLS